MGKTSLLLRFALIDSASFDLDSSTSPTCGIVEMFVPFNGASDDVEISMVMMFFVGSSRGEILGASSITDDCSKSGSQSSVHRFV